MSLSTILKEINDNKKIAETDLDGVNRLAYPYKKGQVESAKNRLEDLYITYKNELLSRAVFILVTGSESGNFAEIAESDFKCFKNDAKTLFREVANEISPQLYLNKKVNASVFDVIESVLEHKLKRLDIVSYNSLMFNTKYERVVKSENEFIQLIGDAVTDIIGPEVVGLDALERVAQKAVNGNYKSKMVPILIHSKDEKFIGSISNNLRTLSPRVVRIAAGETSLNNFNPLASLTEVNETNVGEALKEIANKA